MWDRILKQMREKIRDGKFVVTVHAEEEMDNDDLALGDVISGIRTGEIIPQQRDKITKGWKYRVQGETFAGDPIEVVAKIGATGKVVIITVYRL